MERATPPPALKAWGEAIVRASASASPSPPPLFAPPKPFFLGFRVSLLFSWVLSCALSFSLNHSFSSRFPSHFEPVLFAPRRCCLAPRWASPAARRSRFVELVRRFAYAHAPFCRARRGCLSPRRDCPRRPPRSFRRNRSTLGLRARAPSYAARGAGFHLPSASRARFVERSRRSAYARAILQRSKRLSSFQVGPPDARRDHFVELARRLARARAPSYAARGAGFHLPSARRAHFDEPARRFACARARFCGARDAAQDFRRLLNQYPEVGPNWSHFDFPSRGQRGTPVVDARVRSTQSNARPRVPGMF